MKELVDRAAQRLAELTPWDAEPMTAVGDLAGRPLVVSDPGRWPSLVACGEHICRFFGGSLERSDAIISNDPFVGAWHVTDFTLLFRGERGTAFARMRLPDIGGFELGGLAPQSFDTWGEGARFPALRVAAGGAPRREGLDLVALNSRTPNLVRHGLAVMEQVAAELADAIDGGPAIGAESLRQAAEVAAGALAALTPGTYHAQAAVQSPLPGEPPVVRVQLTLDSGRCRLSLAGSDPQLEAPVNSPPQHTRDVCLAGLADVVPGFPLAPGALDAVELDPGAGTVAGAGAPAITGQARYHTARAIRQALNAVLHQAGAPLPDGDDGWWQAAGRADYERWVDSATGRLRKKTVDDLRALEARAALPAGHDQTESGMT